nr:class I SAM-dependent methyltransferase [uncultured Actinoplanes sp.]
MTGDVWTDAQAYEAYVGRWSRAVAARFVPWLGMPERRLWLDAGRGTGALTAAITDAARVVGVDRSHAFLRGPARTATDDRAGTGAGPVAGDAAALPFRDGVFDAVVSGLMLNFVPRPEQAIAEFCRVAAPGATVAAYVWDYAGGMRMMRYFWDAAAEVDPTAAQRDEGRRFPICHEHALAYAWMDAGLRGVTTWRIEIPTVFATFDDFWRPFLGGQGPGPAYLAALPERHRDAIRDLLRARLGDATIALTAAAWAVRGIKQS